MSYLVIVESPAKANTIKGYLGSNYRVIASKGHIRDLPKSSLGIDIEAGFVPKYINIRGKGDVIKELMREAKGATKVFLATDPDREGEAISWHIASQLGISPDSACRITFNEITKSAIREAIKHPRPIDRDLVNSQQARRILDRLVGFNLSELLWKSVKSGLSGGRVQSVAARIVSEREEEIREFVPKEFWTLDTTLVSKSGDEFVCKYVRSKSGRTSIDNADEASLVEAEIASGEFVVTSVKHFQKQKMPMPPFTTSTLQQEASRRLSYQAQKTMRVAQELYDGLNLGAEFGGVQGLITYMRTDSIRVSDAAQESALEFILEHYGDECIPKTKRVFKGGANTQDAHEAIRPANIYLTPNKVKRLLTNDQYRLYRLIWERFIASQMAAAVLDTLTIELENNDHVFTTGGYVIKSQGYLSIYNDRTDDSHDDGENLAKLPDVKRGEVLKTVSVSKKQHFTEPPPHYTEASLIKFLEEKGIGRPSTYAPIISIITSREYVKREGRSLVSTSLGEVTTNFMKEHFPEIIDYEFTADMESKLDSIERGEDSIVGVIGDFYNTFKLELEAASKSVEKSPKIVVPDDVSDVVCEKCGALMVYKLGRYGKFLACPSFPTCKNTKALDSDGKIVAQNNTDAPLAGFKCELCGSDMVVRQGKFGEFYACSNYPTCRFTKQKIYETGVDCPLCNSKIVGRKSKGKSLFFSCEKYPECNFSTWDMPLKEKCPCCNDNLFYRRTRKLVVCKNIPCDYSREEDIATPEL